MRAARFALGVLAVVIVVTAGPSRALAQGAQLFAVLNGGNEVDATTGAAGAGDPNGFGSATLIFRGATEICYALVVSGIDTPLLAHIHENVAGQNGSIVVILMAPAAGDPGMSSGCVTISAALAKAIRKTPGRFYVNVHTGAFSAGALRGQLFQSFVRSRKNAWLIRFSSGSQTFGPVAAGQAEAVVTIGDLRASAFVQGRVRLGSLIAP